MKKTEALWPAIEHAYALVHQAAHVLANHEQESGEAVRERYEQLLATIREQQASLEPLGEAIDTFLKKTESYWPGLFHCYDVPDLPRTNNELEHCFGSVRYGERRACFLPRALAFADPEAWYSMREQLAFRREARRKQLRFRKNPTAYLAALEEVLLKRGLPS